MNTNPNIFLTLRHLPHSLITIPTLFLTFLFLIYISPPAESADYVNPDLKNNSRQEDLKSISVRFHKKNDKETAIFENPLPFDVPFFVEGEIGESYTTVKLTYKIINSNSAKDGYGETNAISLNKGKFKITVGPLRPYEDYQFDFLFTSKKASNNKGKIANNKATILSNQSKTTRKWLSIDLTTLHQEIHVDYKTYWKTSVPFTNMEKVSWANACLFISKIIKNENDELQDIIEGKKKISGLTLEPITNPKLDVASIHTLYEFLHQVVNQNFVLVNDASQPPKATKKLFTPQLLDIKDQVIDPLLSILQAVNAIQNTKNDLYTGIVSLNPPLTSHIQSEFGYGYAGYQGLNKHFLFIGTSFYFVPVNSNAPLQIFRGRDAFLKRFYFLIGYQFSDLAEGLPTNHLTYQGNLMVGVGLRGILGPIVRCVLRCWAKSPKLHFRFFDAFRLNAGGLIFKQKKVNGLGSDSIKISPFVGGSLDLNIGKNVQAITNIFSNQIR